MATVTKPIALDESLNTTEQSSRNIADVLAQEIGNLVTVVSRIAPPTTVSWNQIEQSGTKIAEITINGTKTDVYAPQGGGGFSALIIVTDALAGVTITATKGGVTKTGTSIGNNQYEISVDSSGTWTISDGTNTATVTVTAQTTYYLTLGVPDGSTVTPTDDIQTLLNCANIWDKSYTTLTELLADSTSLQAVISSNNAIDYLVRSTSFAKANALVPTMTSNTTPEGECFADSSDGSDLPYKAFDGNDASGSRWISNVARGTACYVGYKFTSAVKCVKAKVIPNVLTSTIKYQASNDGTNWTDISSAESNISSEHETVLSPTIDYQYYRLYLTNQTGSLSKGGQIITLQFYTENGLTDNATAMSYIGLNNYASNTLLGDATWCSAICNSTYFESVLNVKVPTMTSNTTPSGECFGSSYKDSSSDYYKAFDGDNSTYWTCATADRSPTYSYIGYSFITTIKICKIFIKSRNDINMEFKFEGSNDKTTWVEIAPNAQLPASGEETIILTSPANYQHFRAYGRALISNRDSDVYTLQFYGRADV